jgi:hypothetical protein
MREQSEGHDAWCVRVSCTFCQSVEELPRDLTERVSALRARLSELSAAKAALHGPSRLVASLSDSRYLLPTLGLPLAVMLLQLPPAVQRLRPALADPRIAHADKLMLLDANFTSLSQMLGFVLGIALAWLITRAHYQRALRPHLLARASAEAGLPTRCRCCGGGLPDAPTAFITCRYCNTQNLVTEEVARRRSELLEQETRDYLARAQGASTAVQAVVMRSNGIYYACWGVGMVFGLVLGKLVSTGLARMLLPA